MFNRTKTTTVPVQSVNCRDRIVALDGTISRIVATTGYVNGDVALSFVDAKISDPTLDDIQTMTFDKPDTTMIKIVK